MSDRDQLLVPLGEAWRENGYAVPPTLGEIADAILASGVLDQIRADAWDEGYDVAYDLGLYDRRDRSANPYRVVSDG